MPDGQGKNIITLQLRWAGHNYILNVLLHVNLTYKHLDEYYRHGILVKIYKINYVSNSEVLTISWPAISKPLAGYTFTV